MAKIKHNNFINTVNEVINNARRQNIVHLYAEDKKFSGRNIQINGKTLFHFGTTGYLGLEQDPRLKQAAIKAIENYGTQFPLSKTYISHPLYAELEAKVSKMYNAPIIITKNSTLGHLAVIPSAVEDDDGVILDHQVHWSVQNAVQLVKSKGVKVEMIRHNNLEMLESKIRELSKTCNKIWYMADGVYSMFGDFAPVGDLMKLCKEYPKLHLYFDDVHGMSWIGKNGTGYVTSKLGTLPENCLLFGTLSKSFGAGGAVLACSNLKLRDKIKNFGGPLTFSAQLDPASVAAAIASADIHLSDEIYEMQKDLEVRIQHFNSLLMKSNLPLVDLNVSPVFFVGTGVPETGYNFVKRLFDEGFFVNLGLFPAVPVKNTGVRITISRHNQLREITALVEAMNYHYPKALEDTQTNLNRVRKLFKLPELKTKIDKIPTQDLILQHFNSITDVEKSLWNKHMANNSIFDWDGLAFMEKVFSNNQASENNWEFHYIIIKDKMGNPVLITFLTIALWKEDMLAPISVSTEIESKRRKDPYYMSNKVLSTGSLLSEGNHWFLNEEHPQREEAIQMLLTTMENIDNQSPVEMFVLRDFLIENSNLNEFLHKKGFIKIKMPDTAQIQNLNWINEPTFVNSLSSRSRKHFRKDIVPFLGKVEVKWKTKTSKHELDQIYQLYLNVKQNNLGLNTFAYPKNLFWAMNESDLWEFQCIYPKDNQEKLIGVMCCYNNNNTTFVPVLVGMDYEYVTKINSYRILLYQTIKRAGEQGYKNIDFGLTAAFEKRKLGATVFNTFAYVQAKDNFTMELISTLQNK
ncbi:aminotransferase class I/II-fold pyridoxal phosphate-dependent enzyme [Xanthomarina gelatinilytica]|uniref:aminotransferase class I/II-fold pyridoxal phosphate-dependent enzyme n=1 Tax=Xanthomarina gelatinilytica TaxID=1137281 RepID=UPI003AA8F5FD